LNWAQLRFSAQPPGPWPSTGPLPQTPLGPWPPGQLGPAHPSPSLTHGPHPFIFLLRLLLHSRLHHRRAIAPPPSKPRCAQNRDPCASLLLPCPLIGALRHQSDRRPSFSELSSAAMAAGPWWTGPARSTDAWTWSIGFSSIK
jgi:hypothetical protein